MNEEIKNVVADAFKWLFIGLLICFLSSYLTSNSRNMMELLYLSFGGKGYIVLLILELVVCFVLMLGIQKMSPPIAMLLYAVYTALTGISLNGVFLVYTGSSIAMVFLVTSIIFGIFAFIGKNTNIDLSKWSTYLLIALIAIILLEIVNIFLLNNTLNIILCIATIVLFSGYVAYDVNKLIRVGNAINNSGIYFAFQMFLDFINIFINLLRLFGNRRD